MVVGETNQDTDLVVVGAGPGGYTAALRAAELGIRTMLVDAAPKPGGVCLHEGCIPSKALLHAAEVLDTARHATAFGVHFGKPDIKLDELRAWKQSVLDKLAQGISGMCKSSGVEIVRGRATFADSRSLLVEALDEGAANVRVKFKHAILATGSRPIKLRALDIDSPRVIDSRGALDLADIPTKLLVVGGGYIGLEMGTVYDALGSEVSVIEMTDGLLPGVDRDLVKPLATTLEKKFKRILLSCKVTKLEDTGKGVRVTFENKDGTQTDTFDRVLVCVGRSPNSDNLGLENTQVHRDDQGFVVIDEQCRTHDKRILAIGDVSGQPMLAHRAIRQAFVAAEVLAGKRSSFDNKAVPAVVFTEPEIAWCGLTEGEAKMQGKEVGVAKFLWSASGRAHTLAEPIGHTKVVYDPETTLVLGVGIVGPRAGDLISEGCLAMEMGAVLEDLAVTVHPHPTLSETIMEASATALSRLERQRKRDAEKQKAPV